MPPPTEPVASAALSQERAPGVVRRLWAETPTLTGVLLEVASPVSARYARPGQYIVLHREGGTRVFLAIASAPGDGQHLELLLGPNARDQLKLRLGDRVELDPPAGRGFSLDHADGRDVFLFSVGSGISAIRPVVEVLRKNRANYGYIRLYAGARTADEHAYRAFAEDWTRDRIQIVRAVSKPWVQEIFAGEPHPVANAVAYVAGLKGMIEAVTEILLARGMPRERILFNA